MTAPDEMVARAMSGAIVKQAKEAFYANQTDIEDAAEAAGGQRGTAAHH